MISGYRNPVKTQWRDAVWKIIAEHAKETDGFVLTLAGKAFLDRKAAKMHGIDPKRVIGVDIDKSVEKHNRRFGRTVVNRPIADIVAHFRRPICAVNADLMCHYDNVFVIELIKAFLFSRHTRDAILLLNVSVGMESKPNYVDELGRRIKRPLGSKTNRALRGVQMATITAFVDIYRQQYGVEPTNDIWKAAASVVLPIIDESVFFVSERYIAHKMPMDSIGVRQFVEKTVQFQDRNATKGHVAAKMAWHTMRNQA